MKHIVKSVALVLALLALCAGICAVAEEENEPIPLTLNVEAEAVIEQAGGYAYFSFTPEETDWYEFTSLAGIDTYGYLYDEDMDEITRDDDSGTNNNFKITYELEEGVPYIFGVRYYSSSNTGSFNVVLRSSNHLTASAVDGNNRYVEPGADAALEVTADCVSGEIHYQWYGRVYNESGSSYSMEAIDGANAASYTAENNTRYTSFYCRVTDDFDNAINVYFYINIQNNLTASAVGGHEKLVSPGANVDLEVSASCKVGSLHYQWLHRDEDSGNYLAIEDATSASLRVENIQHYDEFQCRVSDDYGSSESVYFTIRINNHLVVERIGKYRVGVVPGETATLAVEASCDSGELSYQWYDDNAEEPIEGATEPTYVLENYMGRGEFYCRVEDDYGNSDSVWFYAFLDTGLGVDESYVEITVPYGEPATLEVSAYCDDGPITYAWLREIYDEDEDEWYSTTIEGADGPAYTTDPVTERMTFWCEVRDQYDNYAEARFEVFVQNGFSAERVGEYEVHFTPEEEPTLAVEAHCDEGELAYRWSGDYYDGEEWEYRTFDEEEATCTLPEDFRHGDVYCTVTDIYGQNISIDFYVTIGSDLDAWADVDTLQRLTAGSTATLRVNATHSEQYGELRYRWYKNGHFIEGATAAEYTTPPLTASARFYCEVQDDYSEQRVEFLCIVNDVAIALDTPTEVTLENFDMQYFAFTPAETDTYTLESDGNHDTYVYLFDADFEELARNDDGGYDTNFKLTRELVAGQKYYYGIRFYDDESGSFTILLTRGGGSSSAERYHLYLRPGQTVSFPVLEHEEWSESVEELYSPNSGLLDTDGTSVTALAAGTAELVVRYSENERIYTVDIVDGVQIATPAALREIQEEAFADDASLQFVVLGDAVTRVGKNAFRGSGLKQIVVPSRTTILTAASMRGTTDDLVIVCRRNSRAAKFAQDHEIEYVYMD